MLKRVVEDAPRSIQEVIPEVTHWLCAIIARLQAQKPKDRFATAREVADLLGRCLAEMQRPEMVPNRPEPPPTTVAKASTFQENPVILSAKDLFALLPPLPGLRGAELNADSVFTKQYADTD